MTPHVHQLKRRINDERSKHWRIKRGSKAFEKWDLERELRKKIRS